MLFASDRVGSDPSLPPTLTLTGRIAHTDAKLHFDPPLWSRVCGNPGGILYGDTPELIVGRWRH